MQHLRLTHSELDFWIDVRLREWDGKWLAGADLADEPDPQAGAITYQHTMGSPWTRADNRLASAAGGRAIPSTRVAMALATTVR